MYCVLTHCLSVIIFPRLFACRYTYAGAYRRNVRFSLLRIDWYSNYEMCRFQQRDREERESEAGQHATVFVCLARRVHTRRNTCV